MFVRALRREEPVAVSLQGEPLHPRPHPDPAALERVDEELAAAPNDVERLIRAARERRHAFRYDEEIELYSRALALAPDDWRLRRFRGHRYLSVRDFDAGARDLERARESAPRDFDVAYHLGLAYYLQGEFARSADEYLRCIEMANDPAALALVGSPDLADQRTCMTIAESDDTRVAITEWAYRALRRAGRDAEASALLATISAEMEVSANTAYHLALLAHRGEISPGELTNPDPPEGRFETRAYGMAVAELVDGDRDRAMFLLRRVSEDPHWPGFGRLAAEADLLRIALER